MTRTVWVDPESSFPNVRPFGRLSTMTANSCVFPPIRIGTPPALAARLAMRLRNVGAMKELWAIQDVFRLKMNGKTYEFLPTIE